MDRQVTQRAGAQRRRTCAGRMTKGAIAAGAVVATFAQAKADMIETVLDPPAVFGTTTITNEFPLETFPIDLNHDGITDFTLTANFNNFSLYLIGATGNNVLADNGSPSEIFALDFGTLIGPASTIWRNDLADSQSPEKALNNFINATGYAALQFQIGGETHYGWIDLAGSSQQTLFGPWIGLPWFGGPSNVTIFGYGYETAANTAETVPEPATLESLAMGAATLLAAGGLRRRTRKTKSA